jgi:hypothetical protein
MTALFDHRDAPEVISVAEFQAHLQAHAQTDALLHSLLAQNSELIEMLQRANSPSEPASIRTRWFVFKGQGRYLVFLALIALAAFVAWLRGAHHG